MLQGFQHLPLASSAQRLCAGACPALCAPRRLAFTCCLQPCLHQPSPLDFKSRMPCTQGPSREAMQQLWTLLARLDAFQAASAWPLVPVKGGLLCQATLGSAVSALRCMHGTASAWTSACCVLQAQGQPLDSTLLLLAGLPSLWPALGAACVSSHGHTPCRPSQVRMSACASSSYDELSRLAMQCTGITRLVNRAAVRGSCSRQCPGVRQALRRPACRSWPRAAAGRRLSLRRCSSLAAACWKPPCWMQPCPRRDADALCQQHLCTHPARHPVQYCAAACWTPRRWMWPYLRRRANT